jgi:hypothetical protein
MSNPSLDSAPKSDHPRKMLFHHTVRTPGADPRRSGEVIRLIGEPFSAGTRLVQT